MSELSGLRGIYAFRYTEQIRAWWERRLRAQLSEETAIAEALLEIDAEGRDAEIEVTEDGQIVSRALGREAYRAALRVESGAVCFDKPHGVRVVLKQVGPDELVADEPGKPPMFFFRSGPAFKTTT